jgi:hypothetical protein
MFIPEAPFLGRVLGAMAGSLIIKATGFGKK